MRGHGRDWGQTAPDAAGGIPLRSATPEQMVIRILRSLGPHLLHQSFRYDDALATMTLLRVVVAPANAPNPLSASMNLCYRPARNTFFLHADEAKLFCRNNASPSGTLLVLIQPDASGHD
jgi:hypothetical protein